MDVRRVLLIDDDPDLRTIGELALGSVGGFEVHSAGSGEEALRRAAEVHPDLILLDVMMPGLDGPATLTRLRQDPATSAIPVIFMTAKARNHELERLEELGATGIILKPFDPMTLADQVRRIAASID